jgi:predicted nucleic acid-binding protein
LTRFVDPLIELMSVAIDSSVLHAIFNEEADALDWAELLAHKRREGPLLICETVYAEVASGFEDQSKLDLALENLGISYDPISRSAAYLAGRIFGQYRRRGGPREHLLPDFLIAAHAQIQAGVLAAIDRGYYRKHFATLTVISPRKS